MTLLLGSLETRGRTMRVKLTEAGHVGRGTKPNHAMPDAEFARLYAAGLKMAAIAKRAGMSASAVKDRRRRLGLPGRPVGRPKKNVDAKEGGG